MTIEQAVLENLKILPAGKREEVLEFTEYLASKEINHSLKISESVERDLATLGESELIHLEMEFENYDKLYPRQ